MLSTKLSGHHLFWAVYLSVLPFFLCQQTQGQDIIIEKDSLLPPQNLYAAYNGNFEIQLSWAPPAFDQWIHWDSQINDGGVGLQNGGFFYVASRWEPEDLNPFHGFYLTNIRFFANTGYGSTFAIRVWTGDNAANLVHSQTIQTFTYFDWNEIELDEPVLINASEELWFGYMVLQSLMLNPAGIDAGPASPYKGDLISFNGNDWFSLSSDYENDRNWNLAAWVSSTANKKSIQELLGYTIYRSKNNMSFDTLSFTQDLEYIDIVPDTGSYAYFVTALYDDGESVTSDTIIVDVSFSTHIKTITDQDHPVILFPNPSSCRVEIIADDPVQVMEIFNSRGEACIKSIHYSIEHPNILSFSKPGFYFITLILRERVYTRRIIIL